MFKIRQGHGKNLIRTDLLFTSGKNARKKAYQESQLQTKR